MKDAEEVHIRINNMYLLTELGGGGGGGGGEGEGWIFAGRTDLVQRGAWVLPESQIFSGSAGPNSVNKHSYHMTIVLFNFLTRRSARFSSRAVPVFRANHLTPTALIPDFFSYGFPTKITTGSYESYDNKM